MFHVGKELKDDFSGPSAYKTGVILPPEILHKEDCTRKPVQDNINNTHKNIVKNHIWTKHIVKTMVKTHILENKI